MWQGKSALRLALEMKRWHLGGSRNSVQASSSAPKLPSPGKKFVSGLLQLVVASPDLQEPFSPAAVAAEANRRFRAHLSERVDPRTASDVLRRLAREGKIKLVRKGKAHHEALYNRRAEAR